MRFILACINRVVFNKRCGESRFAELGFACNVVFLNFVGIDVECVVDFVALRFIGILNRNGFCIYGSSLISIVVTAGNYVGTVA